MCVLGLLLLQRNFRGRQSSRRTNSICGYWNKCRQRFNDSYSGKLVYLTY